MKTTTAHRVAALTGSALMLAGMGAGGVLASASEAPAAIPQRWRASEGCCRQGRCGQGSGRRRHVCLQPGHARFYRHDRPGHGHASIRLQLHLCGRPAEPQRPGLDHRGGGWCRKRVCRLGGRSGRERTREHRHGLQLREQPGRRRGLCGCRCERCHVSLHRRRGQS